MQVPFITNVRLNEQKPLDLDCYPGNIPFVADLDVDFSSPVTFFVGENGSGKSTLLEAIAICARMPMAGGGLNEKDSRHGIKESPSLARNILPAFRKQPKDRFFFRAETAAHFATLLDDRNDDFGEQAYSRYGGKSLHQKSHGEAFLALLQNRFENGLFLLDEPESALSPQRQLTLLALMHQLVQTGESQFLIATHSPILLTYPGSVILSFDNGSLETIDLTDTVHYQITRDILNNPEMYWRHLAPPESRAKKIE